MVALTGRQLQAGDIIVHNGEDWEVIHILFHARQIRVKKLHSDSKNPETRTFNMAEIINKPEEYKILEK